MTTEAFIGGVIVMALAWLLSLALCRSAKRGDERPYDGHDIEALEDALDLAAAYCAWTASDGQRVSWQELKAEMEREGTHSCQ